MALKIKERKEVAKFILQNLEGHPKNIVKYTSGKFNLTRQSINNYIKKLKKEDLVETKGKGKGTVYVLKSNKYNFTTKIYPGIAEHEIWREKVMPTLPQLKENVLEICQYAFGEIFNNVIDHSESSEVDVQVTYNAVKIEFYIADYGIGIFEKIQRKLKLAHPQHAILELVKGKFTTDPEKHTGEGIFFTSRICDSFEILSSELYFSGHKGKDWIQEREKVVTPGTAVFMGIYRDSQLRMQDVFDAYTSGDGDFGFSKTTIPMHLLRHAGEELVSRSQAKRLIVRFDKFEQVLLDFKGIKMIGQPFADELFRVFWSKHKEVKLVWIETVPAVENIIKRVLKSK